MDQIKQNAKWVYVGIGILSFLFLGIFHSVGAMGSGTSGFDMVFNGQGVGFSRFLMLFTILVSLAAAVYAYVVPEAKWGKNFLYIFGAGFVLAILTNILLPSFFGIGLHFTFMGWLGTILLAAGAVIAYLLNKPVKK